jgi:AcrR family transcriptional regulator
MAPEDRRQAIIEATTQLVLEHGPDLSTRQIADACGLAEGTLFRAFDSKSAILKAVVEQILDPVSIVSEVTDIRRDLTAAETVAELVDAVDRAGRRIRSVMMALHSEKGTEPHRGHHDKAQFLERHATLIEAMAATLAPHTDQLRVDPETAATFIQTTVIATGMPMLVGGRLADRPTLTDLLVHALVKEPSCTTTH